MPIKPTPTPMRTAPTEEGPRINRGPGTGPRHTFSTSGNRINRSAATYSLPRINWNVVDAGTLDQLQGDAASWAETFAAENDLMSIVYGDPRVGGQVANVLAYAGKWIIQIVWCWGPVDSVNDIGYGDAMTLPAGMTVHTNYTGTGNTVNSLLVTAFANGGAGTKYTYTDTLPNVCYSVIESTPEALSAGLQFSARIKGRKVYDPRSGLTVWSNNPSLCMADFIRSTEYGLGGTVGTTLLTEAANWNDTVINSKPRNTLSMVLDAPRYGGEWIEVMRAYAEAFVVYSGGIYEVIADKPRSSVYTLSHTNGRIQDVPQLYKRGLADVPTVVIVQYTDRTSVPHRTNEVIAYASDDVKNGIAPWRESVVRMPGVYDRDEAYRHAVTRLNKLSVNDLTMVVQAFDEALQLLLGDVVTVDYSPFGINKLMQVAQAESREPGRWMLYLGEYNDSAFSTAIIGEDKYPDTTLPDPSTIPVVTNLNLTEEYYQEASHKKWTTRLRATWDAPTWYFPYSYKVTLTREAKDTTPTQIVWEGLHGDTEFVSPAVLEGYWYRIDVAVRGQVGDGAIETDSVQALGNQVEPTDVEGLTGSEAGGRVYLRWDPAIDVSTLRYEIREGATTATWDSGATFVDIVDSTTYLTQGYPAGRRRFFVKAFDSLGKYSINAAYVDITVNVDDGAFKALAYYPTSWNRVAATEYVANGKTYAVTDWADRSNYGATNMDDGNGVGTDGTFQDAAPGSSAVMAMGHSRGHLFTRTQYATITKTAAHDVGNTFSVDFIIFCTDLSYNQYVFSRRGTTDPAGGWAIGVGPGSGGAARVFIAGPATYIKESQSNVITARTWHHISVVQNGDNGANTTIYVDGVALTSYASSNTYAITNNNENLTIGGLFANASVNTYLFSGFITRLRLWDAVLTAANVLHCMEYRGTDVTTVIASGNLTTTYLKCSWLINDYAEGEQYTTLTDQRAASNATLTGISGWAKNWKSWDEIESAPVDLGQLFSATFEVVPSVTVLSGAVSYAILWSSDGTTYYTQAGQSAQGVARYVKAKMYTMDGAAVYNLTDSFIRVNLVPRDEVQTITSSATVPVVVSLTGAYAKCLSVQLTAKIRSAYTALTPIYDQIELSGGRGLGVGRGLRFNGTTGATGSYVTMGDNADFETGTGAVDNPFSFEMWVKPDVIPGSYATLLSKGSGTPSGSLLVRLDSAGVVTVYLIDASAVASRACNSRTRLQAGVWYHIAFTYNGNEADPYNGMKLYINGALEPLAVSGSGTYTAMENTADPFVVGNEYTGGTYPAPFTGVIDEVRWWGDVRTDQEILDNLYVYVAANAADLKAYYKFDETSGFSAADSCTNLTAKNGTLANGATFNGLATYTQKWWRPYNGLDVYCYGLSGGSWAQIDTEIQVNWKGA